MRGGCETHRACGSAHEVKQRQSGLWRRGVGLAAACRRSAWVAASVVLIIKVSCRDGVHTAVLGLKVLHEGRIAGEGLRPGKGRTASGQSMRGKGGWPSLWLFLCAMQHR